MATTAPRTPRQDDPPDSTRSDEDHMDSRMMWAMMIGCCLVPFALIVGGVSLAGFAGASSWLVGAGVVLAIALVVVRRRAAGAHCDMSPDHHG